MQNLLAFRPLILGSTLCLLAAPACGGDDDRPGASGGSGGQASSGGSSGTGGSGTGGSNAGGGSTGGSNTGGGSTGGSNVGGGNTGGTSAGGSNAGGTAPDSGADGSTPEAGTGGASPSEGGLDATPPTDAPAACNTLELGGAPVVTTIQVDGGGPPAMTGGTIPDGTYHLVATTFFGMAPPFATTQQAAVVTSAGPNQLDFQSVVRTDADPAERFTNDVTLNGALMTQVTSCGDDYSLVNSFTVVTGSTTELETVVGPFPNGASIYQVYRLQ